MNMTRLSTGLATVLLICPLAVTAENNSPVAPQNQPAGSGGFEINWHKIASGGTLSSHGAGWTLAGTVGQHDDTGDNSSVISSTFRDELQGGPWSLTGGFWAPGFQIDSQGILFRDRFED